MYKHILVPTDGSTLSLKAVKAAVRLARSVKARITAIYVVAPYQPPNGAEAMVYAASAFSPKEYERQALRTARRALDKVRAAAGAARVRCDDVSPFGAQPWRAIIETARKRKCDLIVMASHGRRGLEALLLGSETVKVLTHSKTPVLVCR